MFPYNRKTLNGKPLLKVVMRKFLPAADIVCEMAIMHLPSPIVAQKYRTEQLYTGQSFDPTAEAMRTCSASGPLLIYVSNMVPANGNKCDSNKFYAFGRIFSGTVTRGSHVNFETYPTLEQRAKVCKHKVEQVLMLNSMKAHPIEYCTCGNLVALAGLSDVIGKRGTISDQEEFHKIKELPLDTAGESYKAFLKPKKASELPLFLAAIRKVVNGDSLCYAEQSETGEVCLCCSGELHFQICLADLKGYFGSDFEVLEPVGPFQETISQDSTAVSAVMSPNNHNSISMKASCLQEQVVNVIETGKYGGRNEQDAQLLATKCDWNILEARKIWTIGPERAIANLLVNSANDANLHETRNSIVAAFKVSWHFVKLTYFTEILYGRSPL